jgi:hypothetical protein
VADGDDDNDGRMSSIRLKTVRHAFDAVAQLSEDKCLQLTEFLDHLCKPADPMEVVRSPSSFFVILFTVITLAAFL